MESAIDRTKDLFNVSDYRNQWSAFVSGALFSIGWWLMFDIAAHYPEEEQFKHTFYICGVLATIALLMINAVTDEMISANVYSDGCCGPQTARIVLFSGFLLSFVSVIASIWILFQYYVTEDKAHKYPGVALFLHNLFILGASLLLKYGRTEDV